MCKYRKKPVFCVFYPHPDPLKSLRFLGWKTNFAEQNDKIMCAFETCYRRFARLIENGEILRDPDVTYKSICRRLLISPSSLDEIIERELGMKGQEVIDIYRKIE